MAMKKIIELMTVKPARGGVIKLKIAEIRFRIKRSATEIARVTSVTPIKVLNLLL